ncbi:MAG: M14 metallopeptidase family protein [Planctomycetota bacterium]
MRIRTGTVLLATLASAPCTHAQEADFLPAVERDARVPTLRQVLGHDTGDDITDHRGVAAFLSALDLASDRVHVETYGRSVEGRDLWLCFVSSPQNLARLDNCRTAMQALADPRRTDHAAAEKLIASTPAFTWIACSVHGDEISPTDAGMWLAWHLASARGDALVDTILADTIVVIDPLQNPDGRERFVFGARQTRGLEPSAEPSAAERDQPWPGGRFNHALFDMNRDWFALTQPETRARVRAFLRHYPVVYVDAHEMGSNSSFYFGPPAEPLNPELTPAQLDWLGRYGRNNAAWFDRYGFDYFTREVYDCFYPGYGDGWPSYQGAVGMTFEEASVRGLVVWREDETIRTYRESVRHHAMAFLGTCETTARNKADVLRRFADDRRSAVAEGRDGPTREFVLLSGRDPTGAQRLARLLAFQGIEVRRIARDTTNPAVREHGATGEAASRAIPAGSFVVRLDQPAKRLAHVLLSKHQDMKADFIKEQIEKEKRRESTDMYDVSAWSLPLLFGVPCLETGTFTEGDSELLKVDELADPKVDEAAFAQSPHAKVAYVLPSIRSTSMRALAALLRAGARVHVAGKPFRIGDRRFDAGALIVRVAENAERIHALVHALDAALDLDVLPCDSSWVDEGVNFGSNEVEWVRPPRVALAWDRPTSATSAGAVRDLLETRTGWPITCVRTERLRSADLTRFDVVILPDGGGYAESLGKAGAERLGAFVRAGGTLITLGGGATRWLCGKDVGLLATEAEKREKPASDDKARPAPKSEAKNGEDKPATEKPTEEGANPSPTRKPFDYARAILPDEEQPAATPGAILRVVLDAREFVAFGAGEAVNVLSTEREIYLPLKLDQGTNVGVFAPRNELLQSGFAWNEKLDQLAQKAWVVRQPHGKGHVIAFAEDPVFRGFCRASERLLLDAVFFGPAF